MNNKTKLMSLVLFLFALGVYGSPKFDRPRVLSTSEGNYLVGATVFVDDTNTPTQASITLGGTTVTNFSGYVYADRDNTFTASNVFEGPVNVSGGYTENDSVASGLHSHAEGASMVTGRGESVTVFTTASGYISHAEGMGTTASGDGSHAEGSGTTASGYISHAEGMGTTASGDASHAEGADTIASGPMSHAEGSETTASGLMAHAAGYKASATNNYSYVWSGSTEIDSSTADGQYKVVAPGGIVLEGSVIIGGEARTNWPVAGDVYAAGNNVLTGTNKFTGPVNVSGGYTENNSVATGEYSHAEGYEATAGGHTSHAEGYHTTAGAAQTHAEGYYTTASGSMAHAEGSHTIASGAQSHAEGGAAIASGWAAHAENRGTASGAMSHAEGYQTIASEQAAHAEGENTTANQHYAHAEGYGTTASGMAAHAEGWHTVASGLYAHAEGANVTVAGNSCHGEGSDTEALGFASHAEGYDTLAQGGASHAEGYGTMARGENAHAEGSYTVADGDYAHASGYKAHADHNYSYVWSGSTEIDSSTEHGQYKVVAPGGIVLDGSVEIGGVARTNWPVSGDLITPETLGLGNVDNTSDLNKPVSTAQQAALDALASTDLTDTATLARQNAANTLADTTINGTLDVSDTITLGVADLTATAAAGLLVNGQPVSAPWYGVEWDLANTSPDCTRIGNMELHRLLPVQSGMYGCLLKDDGTENYRLCATDWQYKEDGAVPSVLDGTDGQVMVYIPEFYFKAESEGTIRRWKISSVPLDGFSHEPAQYISAYEAALNRSSGALSSVVNTNADYRGGNNTAAWDSDGQNRSLLGRPVSNMTRGAFRTAARVRGDRWNLYHYYAHRAIMIMFVTEYATRNSQKAYNPSLQNGLRQGGLGAGCSNLGSPEWSSWNAYNPFLPCGYGNSFGNATSVQTNYLVYADSSFATSVVRYRGIENPFGHIHKQTDGVNLDTANYTAYVSRNPESFNDSVFTAMLNIGAYESASSVYIKSMISGHVLAADADSTWTSDSTYWCDRWYTDQGDPLHTVLFGGGASYGSVAGLGCSYAIYPPSYASANIGSRLCYIPE